MAASEPLYAGAQINIPPELPDLLKQFTKAAIKSQPTQPYLWALQYFTHLHNGRIPDVAARAQDGAGDGEHGPVAEPCVGILNRKHARARARDASRASRTL